MRPISSRRVVIPVDPSDLPYQALEAGARLVESPDAAHVLVVLAASEDTAPGANWGTIDGESRGDYAIRDLTARLKKTPYADASVHVAFGSPAEEIARFAASVGADLIVLPCRNAQGRLDRFLNGSVAEQLIRLSSCPVLALPTNPEAQSAATPVETTRRQSKDPPGQRGGW